MNQEVFSAASLALLGVTVAVASAVAVGLVRAFAIKKALLDLPNARSSHRVPVPRLGGAAFVPVLLLAMVIVWSVWPSASAPVWCLVSSVLGAVGLYGISLLDDVHSLPTRVRLGVQFVCAAAAVWACTRVTGVSLGLFPGGLLVIAIVGALNIFNFMDGIDGIAGVQAVAAGLAWWAIASASGAQAVAVAAVCVTGAAVGFLSLNWPPAKIFMGDAGSTVLGFILAMLPLLLVVETHGSVALPCALVAGVLVLWPFLADGTFTIFRRLSKGENIFQPHRSHLYQRLVIAGRPHRQVTSVYAAFAALGGAFGWCVATRRVIGVSGAISAMLLLSIGLMLWTIWTEDSAKKSADRMKGGDTPA